MNPHPQNTQSVEETGKICAHCGKFYPLSFFTKWAKKTSHGIRQHCRRCEAVRFRDFRARNKEKQLEEDRIFYRENKSKSNEKLKKLIRVRDPRYVARYTLHNAISSGKIKRLPCEVCGEIKVHAHHSDYSKPLQINWLCAKHHGEIHRKYN